MKESKIKIYAENAEVPEYKSSGASGFDVPVQFSNKVAKLSIAAINRLLTKDIVASIETLAKLYKEQYVPYDTHVISLDNFICAITRALHTLNVYYDYGISLVDHLLEENIPYVNVVLPYSNAIFPTGLHFEIPDEDEIQLRTRSGIAAKTLLSVKLGTLDADWRGNTAVIVQNPTPHAYIIVPGMRLAQGVVIEKKHANFEIVDSVEKLSKTERGNKGLGSTGTK